MPVSKTFACIAEENPDKALEYLGRFVKNAKVVFHGSADAWKLWPYATSEHVNPSADSPFFNADAKDVQAQLARFFFLDSEAKGKNCMSVADQKRLNAKLEAQLKRFKDEGHSSVPVVIMNGEAMPHDKNFYGTFMRRVKF